MVLKVYVVYVILILMWSDFINSQSLSDNKQLFTDIFTDFRKEVIPNSNRSTPLSVTVTCYLMTLTDFEETKETIVVLSGFMYMWKDSGISWDPSSYGDTEYIQIKQKHIWTPPVILINAVDTLQPIEGDTEFIASIYYDGNVSMGIGGVLSAKCPTDLLKFPYDTQTCTLQFIVFNVMAHELLLITPPVNPVDLSFYTPNSDWALKSYSARSFLWNGYSTYEVKLEIKREPLYYSLMVVCPTLLFGVLNPLVFILPVESGERIGLAMTILLSYAIFLTLVTASVPPSSNPMCLLLILMIVTIMVSGIIVVMAIKNSSLYYRKETEVMNKAWSFVGQRAKLRKISNSNTVQPINDKTKNDSKYSDVVEVTWEDVSKGMDTLCMILSYVAIFVIAISYFAFVFS